MKKSILATTLVLALIITGCGTKDSKDSRDSSGINNAEGVTATSSVDSDTASIENDLLYLDKNNFKNNYVKFSLDKESAYANLFISNGTTIVFPNWDDNNNISIIDDSIKEGTINTSGIKDFVNYPTYSLTVINNVAYFADGSNKNSLSKIDLENKSYSPVVIDSNAKNIIGDNEIVYFINAKKNNILQSYDTVNNTYNTVCFDNVGTYFVNGNSIIYQNKSDKSKLYKINIDGTEKEQLTDFSVDSFAKYNDNNIIAINSGDNNNLYMIDLENLDTKRLALMNGENLKESQGKLYFIDVNNARHLSTLEIDNSGEEPKVEFTDVSKEGVNDYYATDKGVFIQRAADVNNGFILLKNN